MPSLVGGGHGLTPRLTVPNTETGTILRPNEVLVRPKDTMTSSLAQHTWQDMW